MNKGQILSLGLLENTFTINKDYVHSLFITCFATGMAVLCSFRLSFYLLCQLSTLQIILISYPFAQIIWYNLLLCIEIDCIELLKYYFIK
jgi:hypothetical protein